MRALYGATRNDDVGLYAAMGMSPQEIKERVEAEPQDLGVWPDNWPAFQVFEMMMTQWRVGLRSVRIPAAACIRGLRI